jgi:hypothetical protein
VRRALFLLAAVPVLIVAPPALADHNGGGTDSSCPAPDVATSYDARVFSVHVSLPVSGCAGREHRQFVLSASLSRMDHDGGRMDVDRSVVCGPFRSAADSDAGDTPPRYSCDLDVVLDHPAVEHSQYDVDVSFPGATAQRSASLVAFCTSDGDTAACDR